MDKPAEKSADFLKLLEDWKAIEEEMVEYVEAEKAKSKNSAVKAVLDILGIEAEKNCRLQQMIMDSVNREALKLSPEDLQTLSAHINKRLEMEEKALGAAEEAIEKSEVFFTRYLLQYLMTSLKKEDDLLMKFDDELKAAHISTSSTAKIYESS